MNPRYLKVFIFFKPGTIHSGIKLGFIMVVHHHFWSDFGDYVKTVNQSFEFILVIPAISSVNGMLQNYFASDIVIPLTVCLGISHYHFEKYIKRCW